MVREQDERLYTWNRMEIPKTTPPFTSHLLSLSAYITVVAAKPKFQVA